MAIRIILSPLRSALLAAGIATFWPAPSFAVTTNELRDQASLAEKAGRWEEALDFYNQLTRPERDDTVQERIRSCLRHVLQLKRHQAWPDRDSVLQLNFSQALRVYGEALDKIRSNYIDRDKGEPTRLFEEGLREFSTSLIDPVFQKRYIPEATLADVRLFQLWLGEYLQTAKPRTVSEAQHALEEIANRARRNLLLSKSNAVVLEFLCGACHSLDEYSSYVPGLVLADERIENDNPSVSGASFVRSGVGYVKLFTFKESSPLELDDALGQLRMQNQPLRSLILDLRGNSGGRFETAVALAQRFLPSGIIASTRGPTAEATREYTANGGMNLIDLPLVLLVDQHTASSAEVLTAALADNRRASIVGAGTFGKGTLQSLLKFKTGTARDESGREIESPAGGIRLTLAKLNGPTGVPLNGITPEIIERDPIRQLESAIQCAQRIGQAQPMP